MPDNAHEYLKEAQAAEIRGDKTRAVDLLNKAAAAYRTGGKPARAEQMVRHAQRLQGAVPEVPAVEANPKQKASDLDPPETSARRKDMVERGPILADPSVTAWCSFCCRPDGEVGGLVAGPAGAYICASCLQESLGLFDVRASQAVADRAAGTWANGPPVPFVGQLEAVEALEAGMGGPARLILVIGPEGCGKTSCLRELESRNLGHYIDLSRFERNAQELPQRRLLADHLDRLSPLAQRALVPVLTAEPKRQVVVTARGALGQGSLILRDGVHQVCLPSTDELVEATGGRLAVELLDRVQQAVAFRVQTAKQLVVVGRQILKARGHEVAASDALLAALAERAGRSKRGGHELATLIARIPPGSWTVERRKHRRDRKA